MNQKPEVDYRTLQALLRSDFISFFIKVFHTVYPDKEYMHGEHIDLLCSRLIQGLQEDQTRLIINLPPRSLKSLLVSVALPAYLLGRKPGTQILVVSYSDVLGKALSDQFRRVIEADWYRALFPGLKFTINTDNKVVTHRNGFRHAISVGGSLTGVGGDIIILDDPMKPDEAASELQRANVKNWFSQTLYSRINEKQKSRIILVMQRLHQDDLTGFLLERGDFEHICLPAIAEAEIRIPIKPGKEFIRLSGQALHPERESIEELEHIRRMLGSQIFAAQYLQQPVPAQGNMVRSEWIHSYQLHERPIEFSEILQSWDTASKPGDENDWSVGVTLGVYNEHLYVLDVTRGKWEYPDLEREVIRFAEVWQPTRILIEDAGVGIGLIASMKRLTRWSILERRPQGSKESRVYTQTGYLEGGRVLFPTEAPWLADLVRELLAFPNGRHDDQVDSLMQALNWFNTDRQPLRWFA